MEEWQDKQAKFDQLPIDVEAINATIMKLNQTMANVNNGVASLEADVQVMVMLLSRVEGCVQKQTEALEEVRKVMVNSFGNKP
jgi:predicted  nucleic acid-binding Zn-ribbon protein